MRAVNQLLQHIGTIQKSNRRFQYAAIGAGSIFGAYLGLSALSLGSDREGYIHASGLGKRGYNLTKNIESVYFHTDTQEFDDRTKAIFSSGTYFHELIQDVFGLSGAQAEAEVYDDTLGIVGHIDVLLPSGVPVEVKTISSKGFDRLSKPLETHTSQLNFYIHSQKSKYGYVLYVDGMDISKRKVFRVGYQPGRLAADVEAVRSTMLEHPDQMSSLSINWLTKHYQMNPAALRGIRHSSGSATSFDSIKPSFEFPGGRVASLVQAAKYRPLGQKVGCIPTLGLTIRSHETAIKHRSRGGAAKVIGKTHCNGSRMSR
jgi:hypothetical protein